MTKKDNAVCIQQISGDIELSAPYLLKMFCKGETKGMETDACLFLRAITKETKGPKTRLECSMLKSKMKDFTRRKLIPEEENG